MQCQTTSERVSVVEELLRSFSDELAHAEVTLFDHLAATLSLVPPTQGSRDHRWHSETETCWTGSPLELKLTELSSLHVDDMMDAERVVATVPGLVYSTVDALVHLVIRLLALVDPAAVARGGGGGGGRPSGQSRRAYAAANSLVDLALLCLANLLESPPWLHVFFKVLHKVQLEQQQQQQQQQQQPQSSADGLSAKVGGATGSATTLQEHLWRRIVTDTPVADKENHTTAATAAAGSTRKKPLLPHSSPPPPPPSRLATPVDHAAVRLCCSMIRHCPLSFPASSYASLAPQLTDHLLVDAGMRASGGGVNRGSGGGGGSGDGSGGPSAAGKGKQQAEEDLMVLLDLFAACARGSPHFRQYVKGLRRKRELFRRLLSLLGPRCHGGIVVRALCALTRVLAGDALEAKVFDRANAIETASLVTDNLLDLAGRTGPAGHKWRGYGCRPAGGTLGEQRRYADVASDLARSRVFTTVLIDTGRMSSFLREAVVVLARAAADVSGRISTKAGIGGGGRVGSSPWPSGGSDDCGIGAGGGSGGGGGGGTFGGTCCDRPGVAQSSERIMRPEPLLRALCSFCVEHSPARSAFLQALLESSGGGGASVEPSAAARTGGRDTGDRCAAAEGPSRSSSSCSSSSASSSSCGKDPIAALYVLCLHPHLPSATAASMLLQCLLVGGGALGAVSGPSPGAVAGVGVIPSAYHPVGAGTGAASAWAAGGIGREDPLQAALLERIGGVALSGEVTGKGGKSGGHGPSRCVREKHRSTSASDGKAVGVERVGGKGGVSFSRAGGGDVGGDGAAGSGSESSGGSDSDSEGGGGAWPIPCGNLGTSADFSKASPLAGEASTTAPVAGALRHLVWRLQEIGADLAAAQAKQQLRLGSTGGRGEVAIGVGVDVESRMPSMSKGGAGATAGLTLCARGGRTGGGLAARSVEMEQELTSLLCLLSSLALACPTVARVLARALPLEAAFAPILTAQRCVLSGIDPAEYPRAPVEIVLVSLTLMAQLAVALSTESLGVSESGRRVRGGGAGREGGSEEEEEEEEEGRGEGGDADWGGGRRGANGKKREQRRWRKDAARASRLRRFLGEQAAVGEVKLCVGHSACRAESKDLARRVASLISLLQSGGGADALLVADALYAFAQSAEAREAGLLLRASEAEAAVSRERAAGVRKAAALEETEGLVAQIESRSAEELRRMSEQEAGARRRLEETHARALARVEASLRRAEEGAAELERAVRSKEDALRCVGRETRAKNLEIASLKGDLAGEHRLRAAAEVQLREASSERGELSRAKAEVEALLEATKVDLLTAREEGRASKAGWEEEKASAERGWAAAREAEDGLQRSNTRAEEAYGKLILLARSHKSMEEESRSKAAKAERLLAEEAARTKEAKDQAREEARRHRLTKVEVRDAEASLERAEQGLMKATTEAAEAVAAAAAARAAGRDATEKAASATREAALQRDEVSRLKAELKRSRVACAEKDLELASKSKELGQQAGIIEYINKLSSNAAEAEAKMAVRTVSVHADNATSIPDSEGS